MKKLKAASDEGLVTEILKGEKTVSLWLTTLFNKCTENKIPSKWNNLILSCYLKKDDKMDIKKLQTNKLTVSYLQIVFWE